ncbi:hypothetical protein MUK72_19800 (plasmid) [Halococcus dombrowskii]|nr:hypothetical protein [Halococcus dombrowskii]UOO97387.1 hypothetical protein MUK72_19800 [Halococcus dombrowskii]
MAKLVYETRDGVETQEFDRGELTLNRETGYVEFQIGETSMENPIRKHIPRERVYYIEDENDIEMR